MGNRVSECCLNCFTGGSQVISEPGKVEILPLAPVTRLEVVQSPAYVSLSSSAEELEEESPSADMEDVLERLNKGFEEVVEVVKSEEMNVLVEKDGVKVCGKESTRGYILRTVWESRYSKEEFIAFVRKFEARKNWDSNVEECKVLRVLPTDIVVAYQRYKKVLTVAPRDMVLACKTYTQGQALVEVTTSIEARECPVQNQVIRAKVYVGGYFAEATDLGTTKVTAVSEMDFGGAIPRSMIMRMSAMAMPSFVKSLNSALHLGAATNH